jgi:hypothetical protein
MQSIYPIKTMDNIPEDISLGDVIKYMNYGNKLTDGVVQRILRPDILFVKDTKTHFEEKIYKSNIVINITIIEKSILDKLSETHNFDHNTKIINTINNNMEILMDIIEKLKEDNNNLKKKIEIIEYQNIIDENTMYFLFFTFMLMFLTIFYSIYPTEFNTFGLILYNSSMIYYNKIQTYIISQLVEYKKVIQDIHHNNSYDEYDL